MLLPYKGLDPAYPLFENASSNDILDKTDARFVDIIHTSAGRLEAGRFGISHSTGHADFWPNGGSHQPVEVFFLSTSLIINNDLLWFSRSAWITYKRLGNCFGFR